MSTHVIPPQLPEPVKRSFTEKAMPDEPKTDAQIMLDDGMVLRERIAKVEHSQGVTFVLTFTELDDNGNVKTLSDGTPLISPAFEVAFMGENATNLGPKGIKDQLKAGREVAAARAAAHFAGLKVLTKVMLDRVG